MFEHHMILQLHTIARRYTLPLLPFGYHLLNATHGSIPLPNPTLPYPTLPYPTLPFAHHMPPYPLLNPTDGSFPTVLISNWARL